MKPFGVKLFDAVEKIQEYLIVIVGTAFILSFFYQTTLTVIELIK